MKSQSVTELVDRCLGKDFDFIYKELDEMPDTTGLTDPEVIADYLKRYYRNQAATLVHLMGMRNLRIAQLENDLNKALFPESEREKMERQGDDYRDNYEYSERPEIAA